jgi:hypothetical protein
MPPERRIRPDRFLLGMRGRCLQGVLVRHRLSVERTATAHAVLFSLSGRAANWPRTKPRKKERRVTKLRLPNIAVLAALTHDMDCVVTSLIKAAQRYPQGAPLQNEDRDRDLWVAAIAFTIQLAIETGQDPTSLRALERHLMDKLEADVNLKVEAEWGAEW